MASRIQTGKNEKKTARRREGWRFWAGAGTFGRCPLKNMPHRDNTLQAVGCIQVVIKKLTLFFCAQRTENGVNFVFVRGLRFFGTDGVQNVVRVFFRREKHEAKFCLFSAFF